MRDYQVRDQNTQPTQRVMRVDETFSTPVNTCNVQYIEGGGNTTGQGTFRDNFFMCTSVTICAQGGSCQIVREQHWKVNQTHDVGDYALDYSCSDVTITP